MRSGRWRAATSCSIAWPAPTKSTQTASAASDRSAARVARGGAATTLWPRISSKKFANIWESTYGTQTVHERGLRVYTTLNVDAQRAANQAIRDGLHAYDRRHGWRGKLDNILRDHRDTLESYEDDDCAGRSPRAITSLVWSRRSIAKPRPSRLALIALCSRSRILRGPGNPSPKEIRAA